MAAEATYADVERVARRLHEVHLGAAMASPGVRALAARWRAVARVAIELGANQAEVDQLRDLLADLAGYLDRTGIATDMAPEMLARVRAAARPIP